MQCSALKQKIVINGNIFVSLCGFNKALNHCCVHALCIKSMPLAPRSTNNAPYEELSSLDSCGKLLSANVKYLWQTMKVNCLAQKGREQLETMCSGFFEIRDNT